MMEYWNGEMMGKRPRNIFLPFQYSNIPPSLYVLCYLKKLLTIPQGNKNPLMIKLRGLNQINIFFLTLFPLLNR
jgi:hypothetical protein